MSETHAESVLIVDDHPLFRKGLAQLLQTVDGFRLVGEAAGGVEGMEMARELQPDLVLLDLNMRDLGGLDAWKAHGLPVKADRAQPIELMRQVQMTAGGLILIGAALGLLVHPAFWGLAAFVGAGLFLAGATGFCGMARMLAVMPWNRKALGAA